MQGIDLDCWKTQVDAGTSSSIYAAASQVDHTNHPSSLSHMEIKSLPLRPGGAENCNITFFEGRGVKNVILQYSILRDDVILQFVGTMMYHGEIKKM